MNRARCPEATEEVVVPIDDCGERLSSSVLNRAWRVLASGVCFLVFGAGSLLASLALLVFVRPLPGVTARRKRAWTLLLIQWLARGFIEMMQAFGLIRHSMEHAQRLVPGGRLIVANHPSLIDALFIIGRAPGVCCIVKRGLLDNPLMAPLVRMAGYLVNDSDTLIEDATEVLRSHRSLLVFPEGTRNRDDMTLTFQRGAAHIAIASRAEVLPVTIDCSPRTLQKGSPWYAIPPRPSVMRLRVHPARDVLDGLEPPDCARRDPSDASCGDAVPVTLLARRVTARMRDFFLGETRRFADPQGEADR